MGLTVVVTCTPPSAACWEIAFGFGLRVLGSIFVSVTFLRFPIVGGEL